VGDAVAPRRLQAGHLLKQAASAVGPELERVVRVVPDVSGIEAEFDYSVPEKLNDRVRMGTIVRVVLAGRHIRGWVVDDNATPPDGVALKPLQKVTGTGPSEEMIDLAGWAAWRWAGKRSFFLQTASPPKAVSAAAAPVSGLRQPASLVEIVRLGPAASMLPIINDAIANGPALIIVPAQRTADRIAQRLRSDGVRIAKHPDDWPVAAQGNVSVVGTRAAAWAPMPQLERVVVLDAHDESLQ
jgi:primosomal protein N' (replication factor Y)